MGMAEELQKRLEGFDGRVAKVGWFESAVYRQNGEDMPAANVAMIHEFGAPGAGIPPRPFFRPSIQKHKAEWAEYLRRGARAVIAGQMTADQVLNQVGAVAAGNTKTILSSGDFLKLSPITLMLRKWRDADPKLKVNAKVVGEAAAAVKRGEPGSTRTQPLHDTGYLIATLINVVGDAE